MNITLDIESEKLLGEYVAYVPGSAQGLAGVVHDAMLTGLLSKWADSAATVPIEDALRAEAARPVLAGPLTVEVDLAPRVPNDPRAQAASKAQALATAWSVEPAAVYLAAVRLGLSKFYATIQIQKGGAAT
jgi:hypothetical protein